MAGFLNKSLSFFKKLISWLPILGKRMKTPQIALRLEVRNFKFEKPTEHVFELPCVMFHNKSRFEIKIQMESIFIDDESYLSILNEDDDSDLIYRFYRDHWLDIARSLEPVRIKPGGKKFLPLKSSRIHKFIAHSLKLDKKTIPFSVNINEKKYVYDIEHTIYHQVSLDSISEAVKRNKALTV